ncbi:MAG: hypothetical protein V3W37_08740 [Candidatus Binatia bacterium]
MKVPIPASVRLGAHEYRVRLMRGMAARRSSSGESSTPLCEIRIDVDRVDTQKVQTFWHEVVHQGWQIFGGGLKQPTEGQCDAFAEAVTQVMTGAMGLKFDFSALPVEESQ